MTDKMPPLMNPVVAPPRPDRFSEMVRDIVSDRQSREDAHKAAIRAAVGFSPEEASPAGMRAAREACGMTLEEWAWALGYRLKHPSQYIWAMENGRQTITRQVANLARMFHVHGVPDEMKAPPK